MKTQNSKAFTLMESLVVVVVLGILAALAVPKMVRVLETRRTAEAEEVLAAVRTEQEKRCVAGKFYAETLKDIPTVAYLSEEVGQETVTQSDNYSYTPGENYAQATRPEKGYTLRMFYKTGQLCCEGAGCEQLNKNYPSCNDASITAVATAKDECVDEQGILESCVDRPLSCCKLDPKTKQERPDGYVWSSDFGYCVECDKQKLDNTFCSGEDEYIVPGASCKCIKCPKSKNLTINAAHDACMCIENIPAVEGALFVDNSQDPTPANRFCGYVSCSELAAKGGLNVSGGYSAPDSEGTTCEKNACSDSTDSCKEKGTSWYYGGQTTPKGKVLAYNKTYTFQDKVCGCTDCQAGLSGEYASFWIANSTTTDCKCDLTSLRAYCKEQNREKPAYSNPSSPSRCQCGRLCTDNETLTNGSCQCKTSEVRAACYAQGLPFDSDNCKCGKPCDTTVSELTENADCACDTAKLIEKCGEKPINTSNCTCGLTSCSELEQLSSDHTKCVCKPNAKDSCDEQHKKFIAGSCTCVACSSLSADYRKKYVDDIDEGGNWLGCKLVCKNPKTDEECGSGKKWNESTCQCSGCQNVTTCGPKERWDEDYCACVPCNLEPYAGFDVDYSTCQYTCDKKASTCKNNNGKWFDATSCTCESCESPDRPGYSGPSVDGTLDGCMRECTKTIGQCAALGQVLANPLSDDCHCGDCFEWYKYDKTNNPYGENLVEDKYNHWVPLPDGSGCSNCCGSSNLLID